MLGDWLEGSDWTDGSSGNSGSSETIFSATYVKKTRYVHWVIVAVLYSMLKESVNDSGQRDFEECFDIHRKN